MAPTPVTVDFSVTSTSGYGADYPIGTVGTGYFTFDDALMPAGGFGTTDAGIATLTFTNGALTDWWIGGNYTDPGCGFGRYSCVTSGGHAPDFMILSNPTGGASLNDGVHTGIGTGYGTIAWSVRDASVPEPATLGLFGLGLTGLGWVRRKRGA